MILMKETLNSIRNRPRFKLYTNLSPEEYETNLRTINSLEISIEKWQLFL